MVGNQNWISRGFFHCHLHLFVNLGRFEDTTDAMMPSSMGFDSHSSKSPIRSLKYAASMARMPQITNTTGDGFFFRAEEIDVDSGDNT
jgi:hypothetical protein